MVAPSLSTSAAAWFPVVAVAVLAAAATTLLLQYLLRPPSSSSGEGAKQAPPAAAATSYTEPSSLAALIKGRRSVFPRDFSGEHVLHHPPPLKAAAGCITCSMCQAFCTVPRHRMRQ
jgi:hypothetical protein